jgi:hypothetical protein
MDEPRRNLLIRGIFLRFSSPRSLPGVFETEIDFTLDSTRIMIRAEILSRHRDRSGRPDGSVASAADLSGVVNRSTVVRTAKPFP